MREKTDGFSDFLNQSISDRAIGELMLAKTSLEEKYEQIEKKEKSIIELQEQNKRLEAQLKDLRETLLKIEETQNANASSDFNKGTESVVIDILKIISKYETAGGVIECKSELIMLIDNIIDLLVSRYGLEVIDGPAADVDPAIHQVVEVINSDKENSGIVRLARGYRMGKKIIMPMKVRVIKNE